MSADVNFENTPFFSSPISAESISQVLPIPFVIPYRVVGCEEGRGEKRNRGEIEVIWLNRNRNIGDE